MENEAPLRPMGVIAPNPYLNALGCRYFAHAVGKGRRRRVKKREIPLLGRKLALGHPGCRFYLPGRLAGRLRGCAIRLRWPAIRRTSQTRSTRGLRKVEDGGRLAFHRCPSHEHGKQTPLPPHRALPAPAGAGAGQCVGGDRHRDHGGAQTPAAVRSAGIGGPKGASDLRRPGLASGGQQRRRDRGHRVLAARGGAPGAGFSDADGGAGTCSPEGGSAGSNGHTPPIPGSARANGCRNHRTGPAKAAPARAAQGPAASARRHRAAGGGGARAARHARGG